MADQSLRQFLRHVINVALGGVRLIALTARDVFGSTTVQGGRKVVTQSSVDKKVANGMSVDESLKVLNFEDAAPTSTEQISERARSIFELNAPNEKEPGSPYLQAKVYWARVRLEHAVQHGEIRLEAPPAAEAAAADKTEKK